MLKTSKEHLEHVHESYLEHLGIAIRFGLRMIGSGIAAILHGVCPGMFQTSASRMLETLHAEMAARKAAQIKPE